MKETDVNNVSISEDCTLLASADNIGRVKLFLYPAYIPRQSYFSLDQGHVNHVKCVLFTKDDDYLITVGAHDCTVMVWSYKAHQRNPNKNVVSRKNTFNQDIEDANVIPQLENNHNTTFGILKTHKS